MTDTGDPRIKLEIAAPLAVLTIARAEKLNALDYEMVLALERAAGLIERSVGVRVAVITGEGTRSFCAGGDIEAWSAWAPAGCQPSDCGCGFIAGFFNARDLYASPPVPSGTTNHAEILYLLAADPTGVWDCQFPVAATATENLGTIPHELEHLTSFSHRLFQQGGTVQVTWLEEGMAHMAEDLNGDNSSNIGRGKLYREDPGAISLEDSDAGLEQRGGIYLMLRLLADRYGTDILKSIVQSKCSGRACIQNVTGKSFNDVLAEFLAAQYLSGKGITADDRFNYTSIDLADFGPLLVGAQVSGGPDVQSAVRRSTGDFHLFSGVIGQNSRFQFNDPSNVGLRSVVVRTQ